MVRIVSRRLLFLLLKTPSAVISLCIVEASLPESVMSSFEVGYRMMERDRKRAQCLFRTQSLGKKSLDIPEETSPVLGNFEPDWSKFESVYASGE